MSLEELKELLIGLDEMAIESAGRLACDIRGTDPESLNKELWGMRDRLAKMIEMAESDSSGTFWCFKAFLA